MLATRVRPITPSTAARHALATDDQLVAAIRGNDPAAFEALYERHQRELLSFCLYMLGSRADAEEALQVTFTSAYRALLADERPVALRPWLFTIARNQSLTILRRRRTTVELGGEVGSAGEPGAGDPFRELELREEIRHTLAGVRGLPERQRAAMVLAELHGLSQAEVAEVLGLRPEQVKALVYQARSSLISERTARDADCSEIREELASARGAALLKGKLRRHVRSCPDCRTYADGVRRRRGVGAFLPLLPWLSLKFRGVTEAVSSLGTEQLTYAGGTTLGGTVAGAAIVAGGPIKTIAVKVAAGAALLGLSTGLGAPALSTPAVHHAGSSVSLVAKPAWLPLLGEGEGGGGPGHGGGTGGGGAGWNSGGGGGSGGGSGTPFGGQPPSAGSGSSLGGIEGGAGGSGGGTGASGGGGASGSSDGSGGHSTGGAAHHVAATSVGTLTAGAGAGEAAGGRPHHEGSQRGQHQSGQSGEAGGSGGSGEGGSGQSNEGGSTGGHGRSHGEGASSAGGEGHPHGKGAGGAGGQGGEVLGETTPKASQAEREKLHEEQRKAREQGRKEREKEHRQGAREHKVEEREKLREKKKREAERGRTVAQREREHEQNKKQNESRKQRELKKREREKKRRQNNRPTRRTTGEVEAAT